MFLATILVFISIKTSKIISIALSATSEMSQMMSKCDLVQVRFSSRHFSKVSRSDHMINTKIIIIIYRFKKVIVIHGECIT